MTLRASLLKRAITRIVKPRCLHCNAEIAPEDINMTEGAMLCRACGRPSYLSGDSSDGSIAETMAAWSPDSSPVARPADVKTLFTPMGQEIEFGHRTRSLGTAAFLSVWFTGWTAGCLALGGMVVRVPTFQHVLFAIPFVAAWIAVACILPAVWFGREVLRVGSREVFYQWRALVPLTTRRAPLEEVRGLGSYSKVTDSDSGRRATGLEIETVGKPVRFGQGLERDELLWIADTIRRHLHAVAPSWSASRLERAESLVPAQSFSRLGPTTEVLEPADPPLRRPHDSALSLERDMRATTFTRRTSLKNSLASILMLGFVCAFWNGIVGVFLVEILKNFQIFLALFLVPFIVIGLVLLSLWVAALLAPFSRVHWIFRSGEVERRYSLFGVPISKRDRLLAIERVELRAGKPKKMTFETAGGEQADSARFAVALVGPFNQEVEFRGLTEGDARWMANELFHDFDRWRIRVGR